MFVRKKEQEKPNAKQTCDMLSIGGLGGCLAMEVLARENYNTRETIGS